MIGNDAGELRATQADRDVLEALDDALGFLMDAEREIVLEALVRHRLSTEARQALSTTPTPDRFGEGYRAGEWQDIASAPRDGTLFDIWVPGEASGWRMTNLWFSENGKLYKQGCSHPADIPRWPTHWRPLPAPPSIRALQPATGDEA